MSISVIGQDLTINKVLTFLARWPQKKRALLLWGPSGIGKTMLAREIATEKNWDLVEVNASDKRSAKAIRELLSGAISQTSLFRKGKIILIDEIDGLSGGDRGAIGEISKIIKSSAFPVILICAKPYDRKFMPLRNVSQFIEMKSLSNFDLQKILTREEGNFDPDKVRNACSLAKGDARRALLCLKSGGDEKDQQETIFKTLQIIFRAEKPEQVFSAIKNSDKSPDEIFRWICENINTEFPGPERSHAYEILSQADMTHRKHKSWVNHLLKFSQLPRRNTFNYYKPPSWFMRPKRIEITAHCSQRKLQREKPYMNFLE
jgi:replication factor C large subunit